MAPICDFVLMIMGHLHTPCCTTGSLASFSTHINIQLDVSNHSPSLLGAGCSTNTNAERFPFMMVSNLIDDGHMGILETNNPEQLTLLCWFVDKSQMMIIRVSCDT